MRRAFLLIGTAAMVSGPVLAQPLPQPPVQSYGRQLNPRDVAEAQRDHAEIVQELGGAVTGPRAAYVDSVGRRVAAFSGLASPGQTVRFTTLNSPVENAFSVPGGYVYVTRQLMTIMDDEAELAFALGHEVAHIAADHSRQRQQYSQRANILGVFGQLIGAFLGNSMLGNLVSQGAAQSAKLRTLSFSRDQEYQSDQLGMRYMVQAGYDPSGAPEMLAALTRATALQSRIEGRSSRQTPEWASTHPLSENRTQRALADAQRSGRIGTGIKNGDAFLAQLEGTYVDDDPAQGVIDGPWFTHPDLRIQFQVPPGYLMSNGTTAVTITGNAGKAQFGGGRFSGPLDQYILGVYRQLTQGQTQLQLSPPRYFTINGMNAALTTARVPTRSGSVDASVVAYQWDPQRVYHFVMLTQGGYGTQPFASMINSLRRISASEAAAIKPKVIDVVTVRPGDTAQSLAQRMAYRDYKLERFLSLNGIAGNQPLVPGRKVKLVVYAARRG